MLPPDEATRRERAMTGRKQWAPPSQYDPCVKQCGRTSKWVVDIDGDHLCGMPAQSFASACNEWRRTMAQLLP